MDETSVFDEYFNDDSWDAEEEAKHPYAQCVAAGLRIIPLNEIQHGPNHSMHCGCGDVECKALGKHPVSPGWQAAHEWDEEQIKTMRTLHGQLYPAFGVVITNGLLVVDVDERNGGHESIARLEAALGVDIRGAAGYAVRTGSGGNSAHYYFRLPPGTARYHQNLTEYPGIDFKTSGFVVGAGSPHVSGRDYATLRGTPADIGQAPDALVRKIAQSSSSFTGVVGGVIRSVETDELIEICAVIKAADLTYEEWVECGMAIHHTTGGSDSGLKIWDAMSRNDKRYKPSDCGKRWHEFGKRTGQQVTLGTLLMLAKRFGYSDLPTFTPTVDFGDYEATTDTPETPTAHEPESTEATMPPAQTNALREALRKASDGSIKPWDMPGVAGKLYKWLDGQCRYQRPTIISGAVLYVLSCVGGLRHYDARDDMGLNVMVFAVSATGTGKEAIFQAVTKLLKRVGISSAVHGKIKSEQEIYRNLLRHQGALYLIDEIGIMLQKITQAAKGTGASYFVAVIGALMEIYSKSRGILTITGDMKQELQDGLKSEMARAMKAKEQGKDPASCDAEIARIAKTMLEADSGLTEPFLTMYGTTTPELFDESVNTENVKNGFLARAIILREAETNPRWRDNYAAPDLDMQSVMRLNEMYWGGTSPDAWDRAPRVETQGERAAITTTAEASAMLDEVRDLFWEMGEGHKHNSGMEGITRRSWEMCSKISLLLGMADGGVRTVDHVLYGFAMAHADTSNKIALARSKDEGNSPEQKSLAVHLKIISMLSRDASTPLHAITKALRSTADGVQPYLDSLVKAGKIVVISEQPPRGRPRQLVRLV